MLMIALILNQTLDEPANDEDDDNDQSLADQRTQFMSAPIPDPFRWYIWKIWVISFFFISGFSLLISGIVAITIFSAMMLEIFCYSYIFLILYALIASRFPHQERHQHEFWVQVFRFLFRDKRRDRLLRVIVINRVISRNYLTSNFKQYLESEQTKCSQNVTYHSLKINSGTKEPMFWKVVRKYYNVVIEEQKGNIEGLQQRVSNLSNTVANEERREQIREDLLHEIKEQKMKLMLQQIVYYALIPLYLVSRVMTLLFPFVVIGYIAYFGLWTEIDLFQYVMTAVYLCLVMILIILAIWRVFPLHHALWHIAPGNAEVTVNRGHYTRTFGLLEMYYKEAVVMPVRNEMVYRILGPGVAELVLAYLPPFDAVLELDVDDVEMNGTSDWVVNAEGLHYKK